MKKLKSINQSVAALFVIMFAFICGIANAQCPNVIWADEFDGSSLDLNKWSYQIGDGCSESICGWGNQELQSYQEANVTVTGGQLHITAKKERTKGSAYTSGRIRTLNKGDWTYGRFEASIRLPSGAGLWPAFWMLPTDEVYGGWPTSGEIDIMEFVSATPSEVLGYIHYGTTHQYQGTTFGLHSGVFPEAFHEFAIEWEPNEIRWFVDGILFQTKTDADLAPEYWPFDQRFHMLLNVAVGGNLGGEVDDSIFPATMDVEYVRVYDGFKAHITGDRVVSNAATGEYYAIGNVSPGTNVTWTVPEGSTIVSGQGTPEIVVDFGNISGYVSASFSTGCSPSQLSMHVEVEPPYVKGFSLENFDEPATAALDSYTGTLTEVNNPSPTGVNTSALVGEYARNATETYDLLTYLVSNINDASKYVNKVNKFYLDVHTAAPVGTDILIQLETPDATSINYPTGRHSRYVGTTTIQNQWERLEFTLLDRPDPSASDTGVDKMIILFNPNSQTGDTYYYDNLDSYVADSGTADATEVHVASIITGTSSVGGGKKIGTADVAVVDNLGNPVAGAVVSGTFSGTFSESASATTGSDGIAFLSTTQVAKGTVTVDFCVDDIVYSLPYNATQNAITCTGASGSQARLSNQNSPQQEQNAAHAIVFPNPTEGPFSLHFALQKDSEVRFLIYDMRGRLIFKTRQRFTRGSHIMRFNQPMPEDGMYMIHIVTGTAITKQKIIKME